MCFLTTMLLALAACGYFGQTSVEDSSNVMTDDTLSGELNDSSNKGEPQEEDVLCYTLDEETNTYAVSLNMSLFEQILTDVFLSGDSDIHYSEETIVDVISGLEEFDAFKEITIPSIHNSLPVTVIAEDAFHLDILPLKRIIIPDSIEKIGARAFYYNECLETIEIPDSVTYIGEAVFYKCITLKNVKLSNNLTAIKENTFRGCTALESIDIPDKVKEIEWGAFWDCTALKSVELSSLLEYIQLGAFENCDALTNAIFNNPNGWKCGEAISAEELAQPTLAAEYLISKGYDWHRKE